MWNARREVRIEKVMGKEKEKKNEEYELGNKRRATRRETEDGSERENQEPDLWNCRGRKATEKGRTKDEEKIARRIRARKRNRCSQDEKGKVKEAKEKNAEPDLWNRLLEEGKKRRKEKGTEK